MAAAACEARGPNCRTGIAARFSPRGSYGDAEKARHQTLLLRPPGGGLSINAVPSGKNYL